MPESSTSPRDIADALLWGLPSRLIQEALDSADGQELARGRIFSDRSSSALAVNVFGPFLEPARSARLPALPGTMDAGWPAISVRLEAKLPFPWPRGRRPNADALIETGGALIAVEAKRREPFDKKQPRDWQKAYLDHDWGAGMQRYCAVRDGALHACQHLEVGQLVRHAFGLWTATRPGAVAAGKRPILFYLHARPRDVSHETLNRHADEIANFASIVAGDEVGFAHASYDDLMALWEESSDRQLRAHCAALRAFFPDTL